MTAAERREIERAAVERATENLRAAFARYHGGEASALQDLIVAASLIEHDFGPGARAADREFAIAIGEVRP